MSVSEIGTTFRSAIKGQERIHGRLMSGKRFVGKVLSVEMDYFQIIELEVENNSGHIERVDLDIVRMRYDAIMYFGTK